MEVTGKKPTNPEDKPNVRTAHVYAAANTAFPGYTKIGRADQPNRRLATYQTGDPNRGYFFVAVWEVDDARVCEAAIHNALRGYRVENTEWYRLHPLDVVDVVERLPIMEGYKRAYQYHDSASR